jgi:hypothetical protein
MKNRRNYYRILHVQADAPVAVIKASYRAQMQKLKLHPDLGGDDWNAAVLNEAYGILSNAEKRAAYDREFQQNHDPGTAPPRENPAGAQGSPATHTRHDSSVCPFCATPKPVKSIYCDATDCPGCDSPLQVASCLRLADGTRRALERQSYNAPMHYFIAPGAPPQTGILHDLSPLGLQFQCPELLREDQVIRIVSDALTAIARVSHCSTRPAGSGYIAGVEFLTLRFHERSGTFFSGRV